MKQTIRTENAPAAIGPYSQAVRHGDTVYVSGQIPLDPASGELVAGDFAARARRVLDNLSAIAEAAGGSLAHVVRVSVYLTDMDRFAELNEIFTEYFTEPYPARAAVGVAALPKGADVEMDAVLDVATR